MGPLLQSGRSTPAEEYFNDLSQAKYVAASAFYVVTTVVGDGFMVSDRYEHWFRLSLVGSQHTTDISVIHRLEPNALGDHSAINVIRDHVQYVQAPGRPWKSKKKKLNEFQ